MGSVARAGADGPPGETRALEPVVAAGHVLPAAGAAGGCPQLFAECNQMAAKPRAAQPAEISSRLVLRMAFPSFE
jgi:hypothetical protein